MMSNYTKGPWEKDLDGIFPVSGGVSLAYINYTEYDKETANDNARLIAAAPELLEALKIIAQTQRSEAKNWETLVYRVKDIACAAIAKAEGK